MTGVASLSDTKKLSRIGGKTIMIYLSTTIISVFIGLILVNSFQPGSQIPETMKMELQGTYKKNLDAKTDNAEKVKKRGPLKPFVDMVPSNVISSASNNRNMLQIVFVAILVGIALIQIPRKKSKVFLDFFDGLIARYYNMQSEIGIQLDSLADMISFGLVPGIIIYNLFIQAPSSSVGSILSSVVPFFSFLVTIASAIRLAKFNISNQTLIFSRNLTSAAFSIFYEL